MTRTFEPCWADSTASSAGSAVGNFAAEGYNSVKRLTIRASDGASRAVEGTWTRVTSPLKAGFAGLDRFDVNPTASTHEGYVDWSITETEADECREHRETSDATKTPWRVLWDVPVVNAWFSASTEPGDHAVPGGEHWVRNRDNCEERTVAGEVHGLQSLDVQRYSDGGDWVKELQTEFDPDSQWMVENPVPGRFVFQTESYEREKLRTVEKELNITPIPEMFWMRAPEGDAKATEFTNSDEIDTLIRTVEGCTQVHLDGIEPESEPVRIFSHPQDMLR